MKKPYIVAVLFVILAMAVIVAVRDSRNTTPPPQPQGHAGGQASSSHAETTEAVLFDLRYRALTAPDDGLSYRSFWGFGASPPTDAPFVESVKMQVQEFDLVNNATLPDRPWSVVELKDKKPVALYFDLDGDGKLSDNEKMLPAASSKPKPEHEFAFITPDFMIHRDNGVEIPFRVMLVADAYGGDRMNYMWSPCCILEGQAVFAGAATRLFLYGDGFSGSFNTFGACSFAMVPLLQQDLEGSLSRAALSSLICHKNAFYRLKLDGAHEKDKTLRVTFTRDTSPTGRITANITGTEGLKARLTQATITGDGDSSIEFALPNLEPAIPVGRYQLHRGYLRYGLQSDDQWQVDFSDGPRFAIEADKAAPMDLGTLALSVSAVDERERYNSNVKEKSTYAKGTPIYVTPRIKGKGGEVYLRFSQKQGGGDEWTDIKPHLTILNAAGKEIVSDDMEYG